MKSSGAHRKKHMCKRNKEGSRSILSKSTSAVDFPFCTFDEYKKPKLIDIHDLRTTARSGGSSVGGCCRYWWSSDGELHTKPITWGKKAAAGIHTHTHTHAYTQSNSCIIERELPGCSGLTCRRRLENRGVCKQAAVLEVRETRTSTAVRVAFLTFI